MMLNALHELAWKRSIRGRMELPYDDTEVNELTQLSANYVHLLLHRENLGSLQTPIQTKWFPFEDSCQ